MHIGIGSIKQVEELSKMLQGYYHEEYDGLNDKTIEEMRERILQVIRTKMIFVLLDDNQQILSFCTIIDPDIGILYIKREHRNKGYGKVILTYCSQLLRKRNGAVFLMTDRDKPESNTVCAALGFKPYFYYVMTDINCD